MSRLVDERVVEMQFDNKNFEQNVKQSRKTIEEFKKDLDFTGAANSFNVLETVAKTAIFNITNKIVDLGIQLAKSLSVDNVMSGWDKYAKKTTSVATLISQGYDMETVTKQLEKLQFFTDETSYTFTEMVSNIGKFTAAGVGLDDSVEAMMGIANWAALSGQNATTASRAMYQLSQAISAGAVRYEDYVSIQRANMDTTEFKQTVLDTAVAMGQLRLYVDSTGKKIYKTFEDNEFTIASFTEYLTSDKWFTSDVLVQSLNKYAAAVDEVYEAVSSGEFETASEAIEALSDTLDPFGKKAFKAAQEARSYADAINSVKEATASAWSSIFETIFGNYEEATILWTDLANNLWDVFIEPLKTFQTLLSEWNYIEGRSDLFDNTEENTGAFWNLYYAITDVIFVIREAFREIFALGETEKDAVLNLKAFTARLKELTANLRLNEEQTKTLKDIFKGIFSALKYYYEIVGSLFKIIKPIFSFVLNNVGKVLNYIAKLANEFTDFTKTSTILQIITTKLTNAITKILDKIQSFKIIEKILEFIDKLINKFKPLIEDIQKFIEESNILERVVDKYINILDALFNTLSKIDIFGIILDIVDAFQKSFANTGVTIETFNKIIDSLIDIISYAVDVLDVLINVVKTYLAPIFREIITIVGEIISTFGGKLLGYIVSALEFIAELIKSIGKLNDEIKPINKTTGEIASNVKTFLNTTGAKLEAFFKTITNKIIELYNETSPLFTALGDLFKTKIWPILTSIVEWFDKEAIPAISPFFESLGKYFSEIAQKHGPSLLKFFETLGQLISNFIDTVATTGIGITELVKSIFNVLNSVVPLIGKGVELLTKVINWLATFIDSLTHIVGAMATDPVAFFRFLTIILVIVEIVRIIRAVINLRKIVESAVDFIWNISEFFKNLSKQNSLISRITRLIQSIAIALIAMGIVIALVADLAKNNPKGLMVALISIVLLLTTIVGASLILAKAGGSTSSSAVMDRRLSGMKWLLAELVIVIIQLKKIAAMDIGKVWSSVGAITVLLAALVAATLVLTKSNGTAEEKTVNRRMKAFGILLAGFVVVCLALGLLAQLDMVKLWSSVGAIILLMGALVGLENELTKKSAGETTSSDVVQRRLKTMYALIVAVATIAAAIAVISFAIKTLGEMDTSQLIQGGIAVTAIGVIVAGLVWILSMIKGIDVTTIVTLGVIAVTMIAFAASIKIMSEAFTSFAQLSWEDIGKGLVVLGVFVLVLAALVAVAALLSAPILIAAAVLAVLGAALLLLVSPVVLFMNAFGSLVKTLVECSPKLDKALSESLDAVISNMGKAFDVVDLFLYRLKNLVIAAIADIFEIITGMALIKVLGFVKALKDLIPAIIDTFTRGLEEIAISIKRNQSRIGPAIQGILQGITIIFFDVLGRTINDLIILFGKLDIIGKILRAIVFKEQFAWQELGSMVADAFANGVEESSQKPANETNKMMDYVTEALKVGFVAITGFAPHHGKVVGEAITRGLSDGIEENSQQPVDAIDDVTNDIIKSAARNLDIHSPSKVFAKIGKYIDEGFAKGIKNNSREVTKSMTNMCENTVDSIEGSGITSALSKIVDMIQSGIDNTVTITPVLDLSEIQNGTNRLYRMMDNVNGYAISGSNDMAIRTSSGINARNTEDNTKVNVGQASAAKTPDNNVINNTFNITGDDPKQIAEEVSKIMDRQVNRRHAVWET